MLIGHVHSQRTHVRFPHEAEALKVRGAPIAEGAVARSTRQIEIVGGNVGELRPQVCGPEREADYGSDQRPDERPQGCRAHGSRS